jgi:septum formation protein
MALWVADRPLVLASKSESRRVVLAGAGIPIEIVPAEIDERSIEACAGDRNSSAVAKLLAREKALAVAAERPGRLVLGADQTLAIGNRIFSKPADRTTARDQLIALRGKTHELHSALAVARDGTVVFEHHDSARLTMRAFSDGFLDRYLDAASDVVTGSVGAYQVESLGIHLFRRIEGSHFTILGLPLLPLLDFLRRERWLAD